MLSLQQLENIYGHKDSRFVEVTDRNQALSDINSKTSCCWGAGQKFGDNGWIQLASPSKQSKDNVRTIFVCKKTLLEEPEVTERDKDIWTIRAIIQYGGHFFSNIGRAAEHADAENLAKIKIGWPEYWAQYVKMGEDMQREDAAKEA